MRKISILEDDQGIREVVELLFTSEGFEVSVFASVDEFMNAKCPCLPDIYLLDVMLPDGDGLEICKLLKNTTMSREIPVIMMSAHADFKRLEIDSKADGFISKPFDINRLLLLINNNLLYRGKN